MSNSRDIGIIGIEVYIPSTFVDQRDLEHFDKQPKGKYTIGLGQNLMSLVGDREDINSISLTVFLRLLERYKISPQEIGRIEVGTETIQDKSKSTKTFLMSFMQNNYNVEGVTSYNACYGAVQGLFNTVAWVESSAWDGRYGVVIASDIAVYEKGPARATGGVGAVALLIGQNAVLAICPQRTSYMEHAFDFYKPIPSSEYPVVDGQFSVKCYLKAASQCFKDLKTKIGARSLEDFADFICFHSPYLKMVTKAFTQLVIDEFSAANPGADLKDKSVLKEISQLTDQLWKRKVEKSTLAAKDIGNIYCGSIFLSLASLMANENFKQGNHIAMFAYGSGLTASVFRFRATRNIAVDPSILHCLNRRIQMSPEEYERRMTAREQNYSKKDYTPTDPLIELLPGTVYLAHVDNKWRRFYSRLPQNPKI